MEHISGVGAHFTWVKEYWHIITGVVLVTWFLLVRIKRTLFADYATVDQMFDCKNTILEEVRMSARENVVTHSELKNLLIKHLDK
jgi:hypothetical protein